MAFLRDAPFLRTFGGARGGLVLEHHIWASSTKGTKLCCSLSHSIPADSQGMRDSGQLCAAPPAGDQSIPGVSAAPEGAEEPALAPGTPGSILGGLGLHSLGLTSRWNHLIRAACPKEPPAVSARAELQRYLIRELTQPPYVGIKVSLPRLEKMKL